MTGLATAPGDPCASCPYRRDTPPGIWDPSEYRKLPRYDEETFDQPTGWFGCHQGDNTVCRGWLQVIDRDQSLALRLHLGRSVDPSVLDYTTEVPCYQSGREAMEAGLVDGPPTGRAAEIASKLEARRKRGGHDDG